MKNNFFEDFKVAIIAVAGFELTAIGCSFFLSGLIWMLHDFHKATKLFVLLIILFQIIAAYLIVKSLLISRMKRREWNTRV